MAWRIGIFAFQAITELVTNIFPIPLITDWFFDPFDILLSGLLTWWAN